MIDTGKAHLPASINTTPGRADFLNWLRRQGPWGLRASSSLRSGVSVVIGPMSRKQWQVIRDKLHGFRAWPYGRNGMEPDHGAPHFKEILPTKPGPEPTPPQ